MSRTEILGAPRRTMAFAVVLVIAIAMAIGFVAIPSMASATGGSTEPCVPSDAWDEQVLVTPEQPAVPEQSAVTHNEYQRYSWNPKDGDRDRTPGTSTPLNDPANWQANTTNYEGAGHGSDPIGTVFQAGQGNGGNNASWFYWTKTVVVDTPAIPGKPAVPAVYETVHHEAVVCAPDVAVTQLTKPTVECTASGPVATVKAIVEWTSGSHQISMKYNGQPFGQTQSVTSSTTLVFTGPVQPGDASFVVAINGTEVSETTLPDIQGCDIVTPPTPATPSATATCDHCSDKGKDNGSATVKVTNTADDTKAGVTYAVTLNGVTKSITLADGKSGTVKFTGLAPGSYPVKVKGGDDTTVKTKVTIGECPVEVKQIEVPAVPNVCAPNYTLPNDTDVLKWAISRATGSEGHLIVTIVAENTTFKDGSTKHDFGRVPVGECETTPSVTTFTVTWPDAVCVAGVNNDTVGSPVVSPAGAATLVAGKWGNGTLTNKVVEVNDSYVPAEGVKLTKTYTDDGSKCGAVVTPPTETPKPTPPAVVTPPKKTPPPVTPPGSHKTPTKVQTDGDSSPLFLTLGGLVVILLTAASAGAALKVRSRRQA